MSNNRPAKKSRESHYKAKVPAELIDAWQETVIENARFPRGTRVKDEKPGSLIRTLAKYERKAIVDLWKTFTSERDQLSSKTLTGKREAIAYLLGFHLVNATRIIHTFDAAARRWNIKDIMGKQEKIKIIDLGCGSGAMAQANVCFINSIQNSSPHIQVRLVDGSSHLIDAAVSGIKKLDPEVNVRGHKGNLSGLIVDKYVNDEKVFTIINLGYVWNEITKNKSALQKINKMFEAVITNEVPALITVVEPGSQDQSRATMQLREEMISLGFMPLYPCPHSKDCPLLEKSRDWCYSEITWAHPPIQKFIDSQIGVERSVLAASAFLFASPALLKQLSATKKDLNIVVGRPTRTKVNEELNEPRADYLLCTNEGGLKKTPILGNAHLIRRGENLEHLQNTEDC